MDKFEINGVAVAKGQNEHIRLDVGRLPSGTAIYIHLHVFRAKRKGPTMLVLGGVHGDEINGVEIVRRAINEHYFDKLDAGNVIAIPLLNVYGFINFSRDTPDGKDVNRSFPGSTTGSLSSRVARALTKKILPLVDFGIDFHTGGASRYNYPQIRYSASDDASYKLAQAFNAPYSIAKTPPAKSLRKVAQELQKPILVYEGGESLRYDGLSIEKGLVGLRRLMHHKRLVHTKPESEKSIHITKTAWLRATNAGMFIWYKNSGQFVEEGERIGIIHDPYGFRKYPIVAKRSGYIIGHNNAPVVSSGDALFHVGYEFD